MIWLARIAIAGAAIAAGVVLSLWDPQGPEEGPMGPEEEPKPQEPAYKGHPRLQEGVRFAERCSFYGTPVAELDREGLLFMIARLMRAREDWQERRGLEKSPFQIDARPGSQVG